MKIVEIEALGEKRLMCCNLRTMKAITQKFGGSAEMREKLSGANVDETLDTAIWLISAMLDGGYRYAQKNGVPCAPPPTEEDLLDSFGLDDLMDLQRKAMEAMTASSEPDIKAEAVERKNG